MREVAGRATGGPEGDDGWGVVVGFAFWVERLVAVGAGWVGALDGGEFGEGGVEGADGEHQGFSRSMGIPISQWRIWRWA